MAKIKANTVEDYYYLAPEAAQEHLQSLRAILKKVAPSATEALKWGLPVFEEKRILFAIAAYKNHVNFVPTASALAPFTAELAAYTKGKDSIQFKYTEPLPLALIEKIAQYRYEDVIENGARWIQ